VLFMFGLSPVRAHILTFLFLACLLLMIEADRRGDRRWVLPWLLMFTVWLNVHGGFVVGLGLLGIHVRSGRCGGGSRFADGRSTPHTSPPSSCRFRSCW
jgi:hypothetical protein